MPALSGPKIFGLVVLALALGLGTFTLFFAPKHQSEVQNTGEVLIGGPFEMVDHRGETVTNDAYRGKFMLVYFGFTYCPDICPTELQKISAALDVLPPAQLDQIEPIFVTVDPERDTVAEMAGYVEHFHDRITGLTGTLEQVSTMAEAYRVWFKKAKDEDSTAGYTMEHTNIVYLMGPNGKYVDHFTFATKSAEMAERITKHVTASR